MRDNYYTERQMAKTYALSELASGTQGYPVFRHAASFGEITLNDFKRVTGYRNGLKYGIQPDQYNKDHQHSRREMYDLAMTGMIKDVLSFNLVSALMLHADKYHLGIRFNGVEQTSCLLVAAIMCGHPANCAIMTCAENSAKGSASSISLKKLSQRIVAWELK